MLTRTRRGLAATVISVAAITGIAACGSTSPSSGGDGTPQGNVRAALTSLQDGNALTFTLKFDASAADFKRLAAAGDDPTDLSDADAKAIAEGTIVIATKTSDKSFKDAANDKDASKKSSFSLTVNAGGSPKLIEVRLVNNVLYARADVQQLVSYGGSDFSELQSEAKSQSAQLPFLKSLVNGDWVKISLDDLEQLAKSAGGTGSTDTIDPGQIAALQQAVLGVFDKDITVTAGDNGGDLGDHYVLSGSSRTVATDLIGALKTQLAGVPGGSELFADANPSKVPDTTVKVDAFVKDGKLNAIKLDLAQFATGKDAAAWGGKPFYIELDVDDSASVSAPSGATDVDLSGLLGGLLGGKLS